MRTRFGDLIFINLLAGLLLLLVTVVPFNILRPILGLALVLFLPGYALIAALFPSNDLDAIERLGLSLGLSIVIIPLLGIALNYTGVGIKVFPVALYGFLFILGTSAIAWLRRWRLPEEERFAIAFNIRLPRWRQMPGRDKTFWTVLGVLVLGSVAAFGYTVAVPKPGEGFTEFSLLRPGGEGGFVEEVRLGEPLRVVLRIANHEFAEVTYRVETRIDGQAQARMGPIRLSHKEGREIEVSVLPQKAGQDQRVEFLLYKDAEEEPYRLLRLWLDVRTGE